jgi:hypothetical protein
MLREAAGRYVALDGRMWRTLIGLLFRPGFLTREYFDGRRRRYIRPARLFLVLSIGLFALLRFTTEPLVAADPGLTQADRDEIAADEANPEKNTGLSIDPDLKLHTDLFSGAGLSPLQQRIDLFNRLSRQERGEQVFAGMLRYGPYAAVALLPLFALLVKLVYLGRTRRYPFRRAQPRLLVPGGRLDDAAPLRTPARRARRLGDHVSALVDENRLRRHLVRRRRARVRDFYCVYGVFRACRRRARRRGGLASLIARSVVPRLRKVWPIGKLKPSLSGPNS